MYEMFCAECKKEMRLRHMRNRDLAKATGYKLGDLSANAGVVTDNTSINSISVNFNAAAYPIPVGTRIIVKGVRA